MNTVDLIMAVYAADYEEYREGVLADGEEPDSLVAYIADTYSFHEANRAEQKTYQFSVSEENGAVVCRFNRNSEDEVFAIVCDGKMLPYFDVQPGFSFPRSALPPVKRSLLNGTSHLIQLVRFDVLSIIESRSDEEAIEEGRSYLNISGCFPIPEIVGSERLR